MSFKFAVAASAAVLLVVSTAVAGEISDTSGPIGHGSVESYALFGADDAPSEIGVVFSAGAFAGLPEAPNNTSRCFDIDGNGVINQSGECLGDYQLILPIAAGLAGRPDIPFHFAMVNFEAHGHPPQPWTVPHFDIHFYMIAPEEVEAIAVGPCDFFVDCEMRERAMTPVPAAYVHSDHADVGAVAGQMGNHLIDTKTPELAEGGPPFTHTWIYGAFEGRIIFHEVMATVDFLASTPDLCHPIKQPQAWERAGYYPTSYCFRREAGGGIRVHMADFVMREAG